MLEDFKDNSFYSYAKNINKYFHAYLFEVDNIEESFPLILAFAKTILCKNHYQDNKNCGDCNKCLLIDKGYFEDLKIIEPITSMIKKEQIIDLKNNFSLKSSNDNNRVYIIKQAECMNSSSANSLLKFIEEPEDNIYGILITTNRKQILPTILSRCVFISLEGKTKEEIKQEELNNLLNFLKRLLNHKEEAIPYIKQDFLTYYETREQILEAFRKLELIIDSSISLFYQEESIYSKEICDIIENDLKEVSINNKINMLSVIIKYREKLLNILNLNINLFMDRFVIEIGEVLK